MCVNNKTKKKGGGIEEVIKGSYCSFIYLNYISFLISDLFFGIRISAFIESQVIFPLCLGYNLIEVVLAFYFFILPFKILLESLNLFSHYDVYL